MIYLFAMYTQDVCPVNPWSFASPPYVLILRCSAKGGVPLRELLSSDVQVCIVNQLIYSEWPLSIPRIQRNPSSVTSAASFLRNLH
jgi:hypothetical protein